MTNPKCPRCGSVRTAEIRYGLPCLSEDLKQRLQAGTAVLGGCRCSGFDALYHCNACQKDFGEPPHIGRYNREVLPLLQGFTEEEEDNAGICRQRSLVCTGGDWCYRSTELDRPVTISSAVGIALVQSLYTKLFLFNWVEAQYSPLPGWEGLTWTLNVALQGEADLVYSGCGVFPPYWPELQKFFKELEGNIL